MTTLLDILILLNLGTLSRARDGAVDIRLIFLGSVDIRFDFSQLAFWQRLFSRGRDFSRLSFLPDFGGADAPPGKTRHLEDVLFFGYRSRRDA